MEPEPKTLDGAKARNLGSGSTVPVCGASELIYW